MYFLISLDISSFDLSQITTDISNIIYGCKNLESFNFNKNIFKNMSIILCKNEK